MHDTVYSEVKPATGAGGDYRKGGGRGKGGAAGDRPNNTCYQCGKTREEHGDKRFCRREAVAAADQQAQPQQAAPPPTPRDDKGSRGGGRGRGDNRKKLLSNGGPKEQGDTEIHDSGRRRLSRLRGDDLRYFDRSEH